jgi:hypothetical protein
MDLCLSLLKAENEDDVERILTSCGYGVENESVWQPLGGMPNNIRLCLKTP